MSKIVVFYRLKEAAVKSGFTDGPTKFLKFLKKEGVLSAKRWPKAGHEQYFSCYFFKGQGRRTVKKILFNQLSIDFLRTLVKDAKDDGRL